MRWSIVGTTVSTSTRWRSIDASVSRASKRRGSTAVHPSPVAIIVWPSPCAWNSGAGSRQTDPASIGTRLRNQASGSRFSARRTCAPFGAPVVPEVRITVLPSSAGAPSGEGSPVRSCARVGKPASVVPGRATIRTTEPDPASVTTSVNSPSWTSTFGCSRCSTALSSGADIDVLSSSESAPSLDVATIVSTKPASLRHMMPSRSPGPSPDALRPRAIAFVRASTSA